MPQLAIVNLGEEGDPSRLERQEGIETIELDEHQQLFTISHQL
jgi:hypothetical protein